MSQDQETRLHIRRCHRCGSVTERVGALVSRCEHCDKPLVPFFYYDDFKTIPLSEDVPRPPQTPGDDAPVRGLTSTW